MPNPAVGLSNPRIASPNMERAVRSVCAIISGAHHGTGLLIGPDLVLTAHHVIGHLAASPERVADMVCVFDYAEEERGRPAHAGMEVGVLRVDVCGSPPSPGDLEDAAPVFLPDRLDYAIIQLNSPMGRRPARDGQPRGWMPLPRAPELPDPDDEIYLLQHPEGINFPRGQQPLRYGIGEIAHVLGATERFVHTAASAPGSSGGPCFDLMKDFTFIGLHNAGHRGTDADGDGDGSSVEKRLVPLYRIVGDIKRKLAGNGFISQLFTEPPAPVVATRDSAEVVRRRDVALCLMDRNTEEIKFRRLAEATSQDGQVVVPRVHVIVCREEDKPELFARRLEHMPLHPTARQRREALLQGLSTGELSRSYDRCLLGWPALDDPERRKDEIDTLVSDLDTDGRQLIVFMGTYEDGMDLASERAIIAHLATALDTRFRGLSGIMQCLVCLAIPERPDTAAIVQSFAGLWSEAAAPPGCGICIELSDIALADLVAWREILENAWGENQAFRSEMENLFRSSRRRRMAHLVDALRDDIDQLIRTASP